MVPIMSDVEYVSVDMTNAGGEPVDDSSPTTAPTPSSAFVVSGSLTVAMIMMIGIIAF